MSKIAVAGNASGTGTLTIAAPNTNSDRTLTLPDVTATVITDSAGVLNIGSGQVYKDGSGNVGIGTSSPAAKLHVVNTAYIKGSASTDGDKGITIGSGSGAVNTSSHAIRTGGGLGDLLIIETETANSSGQIVFNTNSAERMRIDSAGRVGIGTSSPNFPLSFGANIGKTIALFENAGASVYGIGMGGAGSAGDPYRTKIFSNGSERIAITDTGNVGIGGTVDNHGGYARCLQVTGTEAALELESSSGYSYVAQNGVDLQIRNVANGVMPFYTNNTERMRIDSSGNLLVGTTSAPAKLTVSGAGGTNVWVQNNINAGTGAIVSLGFSNANGLIGYVQTSGSTTSYITSSDYRLKTDAQPMTGASDRVLALNPVNFEWISSGERVDGFLAHEAAEVVPEAVSGEKDAVDAEGKPVYQGIDQSKLVPLLTAALQEALARIETLEADVATLKGAA
jgi:hypothetical protein